MKLEIKACIECKYCKDYDKEYKLYGIVRCSHPEIATRPNVIEGGYFEKDVKDASHGGICGIEAKYWEAKE